MGVIGGQGRASLLTCLRRFTKVPAWYSTMGLALLILIPLLVFSLWAFFHFTPSTTGRGARLFNGSAIVVGALLCVGWSARTYFQMVGTVDRPWWPVVSALGSMAIFPVWLLLAGVIRGVVFPDRHAPGLPGGS